MKISGVYKITNTITGDFYIGSSVNIKRRWATHKCPSKWNQHPNSKLYKDMAQFGLDNFLFEIIEETEALKEREQYYIEQLNPNYNDRQANGQDTERIKETRKRCSKVWDNRLCCYDGKTLTLSALSMRFHRAGIAHYISEAKKYLI